MPEVGLHQVKGLTVTYGAAVGSGKVAQDVFVAHQIRSAAIAGDLSTGFLASSLWVLWRLNFIGSIADEMKIVADKHRGSWCCSIPAASGGRLRSTSAGAFPGT